ncbi:hypothetical protein QBC44DRAFT_318135 [Cladorrhinum sp. PSN332]|nr:hypothetical protein QBC44DRAFT_318135 [Cladorrhinum sp. PSN332]
MGKHPFRSLALSLSLCFIDPSIYLSISASCGIRGETSSPDLWFYGFVHIQTRQYPTVRACEIVFLCSIGISRWVGI